MKKGRLVLYVIFVLSILWVLSLPAFGAQHLVIPIPGEVPNVVGVAVGVAPDYEGSDDYTFGVLPAINLQFENRYIRLLGNWLGVNILNHEIFEFGPVASYRFGRDNDIDDDVVKKMHEVDDSFELGAFVGFTIRNEANPRIRYGADLEFLHDVSDGHDGYTVELSARGWYPVSKSIDLGLVGGATYADGNYMSSNFGVTPQDSALSGLQTFRAGSGLKDLYIQPSIMIHFSTSWHLGAGVRFTSLLSDADDSPIVDIRGSSTQVITGVGIVYSW